MRPSVVLSVDDEATNNLGRGESAVSGGWGKAQRFTHEYLRKESAEWPPYVYCSARTIASARVRAENPDSPDRSPTRSEVETIRRAMRRLADRHHIIVTYIEGQICARIAPSEEQRQILKQPIPPKSARRRRSSRRDQAGS